jgi:hypothetical protein
VGINLLNLKVLWKSIAPLSDILYFAFFDTEYYQIFNQNLILDKGNVSLQIIQKNWHLFYLLN